MRMQVGRVLAAAVVAGVLVSACGGPSQVNAAAIVGDHAIPLEQVQGQLASSLARADQIGQLAQQGVGPQDIAREVVTRAVLHDLLATQTAAQGITVSDADVDADIKNRGGADKILETDIGTPDDLRTRVRDQLLAAQLGKRAVGGLAVKVDIVAATSKADADAKAATLAKGGPAADALFGNPQSSAKNQPFTAATDPDDAATVLFGVPQGRIVVFQPNPQQASWIVFTISERRTDAPSDPAAVAQISQDQLTAIGQRLLQPEGEAEGIRINPRYGAWDPIQQRVVATGAASGEILPTTTG